MTLTVVRKQFPEIGECKWSDSTDRFQWKIKVQITEGRSYLPNFLLGWLSYSAGLSLELILGCMHVCMCALCVCTSVCVYTHVCLKACLYSLFCNWSFCVFTLCFLNCFNYVFPALYSFHQGLHFLFSKNTFAPSLAACLSSLPSAASFTFPLVGSPFKSSGLHHLPLPAFYFFVNFWSAQLLFFKAHSREYFLD